MRFLTVAFLAEKYGTRLTVDELAEVLKLAHRTVRNRLSAGNLWGAHIPMAIRL